MNLRTAALAAALTLPLAGCGDATPTGPVTLSAADTKLLYQELETTFSRAELDRSAPGLRRAATPGMNLDAANTIGVTVNCTGGGSANFSGTDNSTPSTPAYDVSVSYSQCQTDHFELSGNYHQTIVTTASGTGSSIATTGTGDITVKPLSSGASGTCHIDFKITVGSGTITATGSFCGVDVAGTLNT